MNDFKPFLEVLSGPQKGKQYVLPEEDTLHFGRSHDNDVILDDKRVSRHHAQITFEEGTYYLIDLETSNGTFINQKKILNQKLSSGDILQIGKTVFRFIDPHSTSKKVSLFQSSSNLQQERISSELPKTQSSSTFRMLLYGFGGILLLLTVFVLMQPTPEQKIAKAPEDRKTAAEEPIDVQELPKIETEKYALNYEKANLFYQSGYREYHAENYLRALDDFSSALELYPDHHKAKLYLEKTQSAITQAVTEHYKSAMNYFDGGQYERAIYHFQQVISLLKNRQPPQGYCQVSQERQLLHNEDFEKYCDSLLKIEQAQTQLSKQGF